MNWNVGSACRRLRSDRRGSVAMLGALAFVSIVGFGAIVVDVGYVFHAERVLQAAADAAALAGANQLASGSSAAISAANSYSAASGDENANANLSVTATPQTVSCTGYTGATCTVTASNPNGITVTQTATAQTFFARVLGINSVPISATSYALGSGGKGTNADVMIILDTTSSMGAADTDTSDPACAGDTREQCAIIGVQTLLKGFSAPLPSVGLMIFPGLLSAADAAKEYCSGGTPRSSYLAAYNASANPPTTQPPYYLVVGLENTYQSSAGVLDTSDNLVKAAGGSPGCSGVIAYGGEGTYYANVITAAQNYLTANGSSSAQKFIILLSDGDANNLASPPSGQNRQECHEGITAAQAAQTAGTTVVTIAYGSPTSGSCDTDTSPTIQACTAMTQMATVGTGTAAAPEFFYTDDQGATACDSTSNTVNNLTGVFQSVQQKNQGAGAARLIPNS